MPHFKSLVTQYIDRVDFAVVVLTKKVYTEKEIQKKIGLKIPIWFDSSLATACGVYSTPQAVIIEPGNKLYYRGNYNRNRYCTDIKSNYAQQALETFLYKKNQIQFSQLALKAYGCPLPNCTQQ